MLDTEFLTIIGLGFVLGLRHALDTDHLAAVSTVLAQRPSFRAAGMIGFSWGLGHTAILLLVGAVVLVCRVPVPAPMALAAEFGVGAMLVLLGGLLGLRLVRERWHVHRHEHDETPHLHLHSHALTDDHGHTIGGMIPSVPSALAWPTAWPDPRRSWCSCCRLRPRCRRASFILPCSEPVRFWA